MTHSASTPDLPELQPPDDEEEIRRTFEGYRSVLATMTTEQLMGQLTTINAELESQNRTVLARAVSRDLSEYISILDQPVLRLRPTDQRSPEPRDRGRPPSPSRQPSPVDLLFGSSRGKRLAAKLVGANARSINGNRRR